MLLCSNTLIDMSLLCCLIVPGFLAIHANCTKHQLATGINVVILGSPNLQNYIASICVPPIAVVHAISRMEGEAIKESVVCGREQ